ncbi:MAG: hypothetical protein HYY44_06580 [Deltaproteobacteria bacterium]|nr:hypothetical protein [Deltaproteobacteria bacterium]MBI4373660.1 hypothetical protein [Deltaproteobacteria bacterium]
MATKWLKKVDHVTYAVADIRKWAWYHIEVEGGELINRIDDVMPESPDSSMKLWCVDYGNFGIALVEGIDRKKESQVTTFVKRHGDHSVQHVAYGVNTLDSFMNHLSDFNCHPRGETLVRNDGFGPVKQVFGKGYQEEEDPANTSFPEYVERPGRGTHEGEITFSQKFGKGFYSQIEEAREKHDRETLIDFSRMPRQWEPVLVKR